MSPLQAEWDAFDWFQHMGPKAETPYDRKLRMLVPLSQACAVCSMCELGLKPAIRNENTLTLDPHVFSNMNPTRFMVCGQNPGWNELKSREPFVGEAGENFNLEIAKHGLNRNDFYICNAARCYTQKNTAPTASNLERCEPFLAMEINLIKPKLVIALGSVAFGQLCPGVSFTESLKTIVKSAKFKVPVFPVYHPSPLNLDDDGKRKAFEDQIRLMCGVVAKLKLTVDC